MDSNHRNPKMTDLQSVAFNHSATYPLTQQALRTRYIISILDLQKLFMMVENGCIGTLMEVHTQDGTDVRIVVE